MLAAFDEGIARISRAVADAAASERGWRERLRAGLVALLQFLDEQPAWAHLLLVGCPINPLVLAERRQRSLAELARLLDHETHGQIVGSGRIAPSPSLTAELVVGGVFSVIQAQALDVTAGSLKQLAPSLMAFIAGPYQAVEYQLSDWEHPPVRPTYRTTRVLDAIGASPCSSNRDIADAAGLRDEGQTSKLLSRLEQRGLVENVGLGAAYGEPNAWRLTASGEGMLRAAHGASAAGARAAKGRMARSAA